MEENMDIVQTADTEIDSAWEDDDFPTHEEEEPVSEQADQPAEEPVEESEPAPEELFTIKNRDVTRQVSRQEVIAMAQKGWDYDTVRQERDQLRQYRDEANPALELVKSYAQRSGMDLGAYLDYCRRQELMAGGMSEELAREKVGMERERADLDAREAKIREDEEKRNSEAAVAQQKAEARQRDFDSFLSMFPGVDPQNIPQEVWAAVQNGESLTTAYMKHENERLKAELAAERQNKANQSAAPGSMGGNAGKEMDEIDRLWAEDD